MSELKLISIVIPVYNVAKYLARCLDSVCGQSYRNIEVIIIDDGSMDGSSDICDEYATKDSRIRVVHKNNEGVAKARNMALDIASGDMIAFADADDYYEPDMIFRLYTAMIENSADMVSCGYYEEHPDRREQLGVGRGNMILTKQEAYMEYFRMGGALGSGCWNKMFRVELVRGIRFKDYTIGEDVEFLCRLIDKCDKIVCIDYSGYHYIHHDESATRKAFRPANMDILHAVDDMVEYTTVHNPELLEVLYGFQASWYMATLQVMKRSGNMRTHMKEQEEIRRRIKDNMVHYRNNPYVYKVDLILLVSFLMHCFVPVHSLYEMVYRIRHSR